MIDKDIKFYSVPLVISVTLYKNNYTDNLIIGNLKRHAYTMEVPNEPTRFSVTADQFRNIIFKNFKKKVENIENLPIEMLPQHVNSAYFLYNMFLRFNNLEMVNVTVSNNRKYTRIYKVDDQNMVGFNYKILQGVLDYPEFLSFDQLKRLNNLLKILGLNYNNTITLDPYYIIRAQDYMNKLARLESELKHLYDEYSDIIEITFELVEQKLEEDNSYLIIKTDFDH